MSKLRVIIFDPENIASCLAAHFLKNYGASEEDKDTWDTRMIPWYIMKTFEYPEHDGEPVELNVSFGKYVDSSKEESNVVVENIKEAFLLTQKEENPELPRIVEVLADEDNGNYLRIMEGAKLVEHDPRIDDGTSYLQSLLDGEEKWNALMQTINLGAVACMVKNQVYGDILRKYPHVEIDDDYFRQYKEYREKNNVHTDSAVQPE